MTPTEVKEIIKEQLPVLIDDPAIRDFVLRTVSTYYTSKKETESNFERLLSKIDNALLEMKNDREENARKWKEQEQKQKEERIEQERKWKEEKEEQERKRKEEKEEQERKWKEEKEEQERKRKEDREEQNHKWDEQHKLNKEILREIKEMNRKHESTVGALGSRWGLYSEASFRNALKGILEESFAINVLNIIEFDEQGDVFGRPDQIEIDIIIKNGLVILCEIKSSMSKSDMYTFDRKALFYQKLHNRVVNRKIVISPMVDEKALKVSKELGIEVYSYADSVTI